MGVGNLVPNPHLLCWARMHPAGWYSTHSRKEDLSVSKARDAYMASNELDKRAPMAAAPIKYRADGLVDWGDMWDSFCVLAREGGPPHRATMLQPQTDADITSAGYCFAVKEIC